MTFQQVQKYGSGSSRISAGRLYRIAEVLDSPIPFFYASDEERRSDTEPLGGIESDFLQTSAVVHLMRAYSRIMDRDTRLRLLRLTESLAAE